MNNYFAFIDESGNSTQERFFGLGLLIIDDEIGDFYDAMKPYYDRIFEAARLAKIQRLQILQEQGDVGQIAQIANSNIKFELKFKYVNFSNNLIYKELVNNFFKFPHLRFCTLVIDRREYQSNNLFEPWDAYVHNAAMLLANNVKNINPCQVCVLADDLTKPKNIIKTFERSLKDATHARLLRQGLQSKVFGVARLESHASLLLQVVDILLGAVMYDFKKQAGIISPKLEQRQEVVVGEIRGHLGVTTLAKNQTLHRPNYFSVWKLAK